MDQAQRYLSNSGLAYAFYLGIAAVAGLSAMILLPPLISPDWQWLAYILTFVFAASAALGGWQKLREVRFNGYLSRAFSGYAGRRYPIFHLLRHVGPEFDRAFTDNEVIYSVAEADDGLLFIANSRRDRPHALSAGTIVRGTRSIYLAMPRHRIVDVAVIERTDEQIKSAAVDPRDFAERFASFLVQQAMHQHRKTTIIPFAAYVVVTLQEDDGLAYISWAIPTNVSGDVLKAMGDLSARSEEGDWLVEAAIDKAKSTAQDVATDAAEHGAELLVGAGPVELLDDGLGLVSEARSWLDPDAASIATTAGERGRTLARMIGQRIRRYAGLPEPVPDFADASAQ